MMTPTWRIEIPISTAVNNMLFLKVKVKILLKKITLVSNANTLLDNCCQRFIQEKYRLNFTSHINNLFGLLITRFQFYLMSLFHKLIMPFLKNNPDLKYFLYFHILLICFTFFVRFMKKARFFCFIWFFFNALQTFMSKSHCTLLAHIFTGKKTHQYLTKWREVKIAKDGTKNQTYTCKHPMTYKTYHISENLFYMDILQIV